MKEEKYILKEVGTRNSFNVPEGYFENFTQELMSKLPEKDSYLLESEPTLWQRIKPWIYMTAMFVGIMLSVRVFVGKSSKDEFPITQADAEHLTDEEWEIIVNRALINNYDLYEFLTEADINP